MRGELDEDRVAAVAEHVDACSTCETRVVELERSTGEVVAALRRSADSDAVTAARDGNWDGSLRPGDVLDDYVVDGPVGEGGMGQVYRATHRRMRRTVAIKVMSRGALQSPESVDRFHREIEAVAGLSHPNVALAYDAGEWQGRHYLVMEHIAGRDLARLVRERGPLPIDRALSYVVQAARGLRCAHEHGIVHRDVKPANLMLADDGTVKVLDLGLARRNGAADADAVVGRSDGDTRADGESTARFAATQAGTILGTCYTMSPEQALGSHRADARSDIYSLGCTLFFLAAGRYPFEGMTVHDTLAAHREEPIPILGKFAAGVSPQLERAFQRMMAKRPEGRFASMDEVVATLERCGGMAGRRARRRRFALAAGAALAVAAAWGLWSTFAGSQPDRTQAEPGASARPAALVSPVDSTQARESRDAWARYLGRRPERVNGIGMKLVLVPPGEMWLEPNYRATISRPLEIGACEVTVGEFRRFVEATGHVTDAEVHGGLADVTPSRSTGYNWRSPGFTEPQTEAHPALQISWRDATAFCAWLSDKESVRYRLPTEAEWEWAARAGAASVLPRNRRDRVADFGWTEGKSELRSHPVGLLRANAWGMFDVVGNAAEWCQDVFQSSLPKGAATDPQGPPDGPYRTLLGSAFHSPDAVAGERIRGNAGVGSSHWGFGFRVACEIPDSPSRSDSKAKP